MKTTPYFVSFDGMCWPRVGEKIGLLGWRLRYGNATREDLLMAASILTAYGAIVFKSQKDRNKICRLLKRIEQEPK